MMPMMLSFLLLAARASAAPSGVAKPTPRQLEWVEMEIAALIHFNMASTRNCSEPAAFSPDRLDTDQASSYTALQPPSPRLTAAIPMAYSCNPYYSCNPHGLTAAIPMAYSCNPHRESLLQLQPQWRIPAAAVSYNTCSGRAAVGRVVQGLRGPRGRVRGQARVRSVPT